MGDRRVEAVADVTGHVQVLLRLCLQFGKQRGLVRPFEAGE